MNINHAWNVVNDFMTRYQSNAESTYEEWQVLKRAFCPVIEAVDEACHYYYQRGKDTTTLEVEQAAFKRGYKQAQDDMRSWLEAENNEQRS